jgi:hypothetical protein
MGRWGPGHFDDDGARDYLADIIARFEQFIERILAGDYPARARAPKRLADEGECYLMPTVDVIIALHERFGSDYLPKPETVARWSQEYLSRLDRELLEIDPNPNFQRWFREERRPVIKGTFDRLMSLAEEHWRDDASEP